MTTKLIKVFTEGDDDRVVLERLRQRGYLPQNLDIVRRRRLPRDKGRVQYVGGKDQLVRDLATVVGPEFSGRGIIVRDLDDLGHARIVRWFQTQLKNELPNASLGEPEDDGAHVALIEVKGKGRTGLAVVVDVGVPYDPWIVEEMSIEQFAMDDYLILLARDPDIYSRVSEFHEVPATKAMPKLEKTTELLRNNRIPIRHTKRLLHLLRGITGFRASPAECASRLLEAAEATSNEEGMRARFQPLLGSMNTAVQMIEKRESPRLPGPTAF